jgi:GNAT superfamily N-acetyltransferase
MTLTYQWRGDFTNHEVNLLHAEAFGTKVFDESEWNWVQLVHQHSLGWVVARDGTNLVGFVNILWDGLVHAWLQDTMVAAVARGQGIGTGLVDHARRVPGQRAASTYTWTSKITWLRSATAPAASSQPAPDCWS